METRLVYSEIQETFIKEFSEVLKCNEHERLPSYDPGFSQLTGAIVIKEPSHVVKRTGQTLALCELIGRLYRQSIASPIAFAMAYTRIDKRTLIEKYMLLNEVRVDQDDVSSVLRKWLLDLFVIEAIEKHHFYYIIISHQKERLMSAMMKRNFPGCDQSFFKLGMYVTGLSMDISHDNVVIVNSYSFSPIAMGPVKYMARHLFTK